MSRIGLQLIKAQPENKSKLEYFRKKILDHLSKLEKQEEESVNKALSLMESLEKAGFPVGTIRTWKGVRHIKMPDGKWRPKYDDHTRGAKMAISVLKKRITAAKDEHEMMQIILANRDRFDDQYGHPLPFVQELHNYIEEQKTVRENAAKPKPQKPKPDDKGGAREDNSQPKTAKPDQVGREASEYEKLRQGFLDGKISRKQAREALLKMGCPPRLVEEIVPKNGPEYYRPKSNPIYTGGTREMRLNWVKDDYKAGKIDFDATVKEYMAIYPKLSKVDAEKTVRNVFEQPSEKQEAESKQLGEPEESEDEKRRNRSEAMEGNKNAYKGGPKEGVKRLGLRVQGRKPNDQKKAQLMYDTTISKWLEPESLSQAKGKTRDEIFSMFGNEYEPVAAISPEYLKYLGADVVDPTVYSGKGYFIDHVVNHHPEIDPAEYTKIPEILDKPDDVKLDDRNPGRTSLVFVKKFDRYGTVIVSVDVTDKGKIVIHKSFFNPKKSPYPHLKSIRASSPDAATSSISHTDESVPGGRRVSTLDASPLSTESGDKSSGDFEAIQAKYRSAKAIEGDEDEVQIGKETISGKWKLVEADTPTASHDETTFHKTPGFPTNADGSTINDRDYGHDRAAQDAVLEIGSDFDGRALRVDNPVIVTTDGIVISGNNRTMSSKIAAKKGTDAKYIEALKKRAKKFGFTAEQVGEFKNPRVVFEVEKTGDYSTEEFAKFNESGKKEMGPTEKAVKVSKLIKPETVSAVAEKIGEFETLGELYADRGAVQHVFSAFKDSGLIGEFEIGKYIENGSVTEDGKTFIETALLGSVMSENNIRGFNRPGCKSIRATLVRAITPLIENKSMGGYSITRELNEAVDIAMQAAIARDKFKSVEEFAQQQNMFESIDKVAVELAKKLEGTQKAFAEFMQKMNGSLKYAANGEADIFLGDVESKEDILGRFLTVKKAVSEVLNGIKGLLG